MTGNTLTGKEIISSILNSYSQIFFSKSKVLAVLLMVISFFDYGAGMGGFVAVIIANFIAWVLGYNKYNVSTGLY
jgi:urea transporter